MSIIVLLVDPAFELTAYSIAHCPLQAPSDVLHSDDENQCKAQTPYIYPDGPDGADNKCQSTYHVMVSVLDKIIGNISSQLKAQQL